MSTMSSDYEKEWDESKISVIKEIYDSENALEMFGEELERALEAGSNLIVVEPSRLGDETARWIAVGNCLHKTAVITGIGAIVAGFGWSDIPLSYTPLCVCSFFCTGLYTVSWQFDPCVKYQVMTDTKTLARLPLFSSLTSASPVVLVRKNDNKRKILHTSVTLVASVLTAYHLYYYMNK